MANPQKEDGYTPIANDILDALAKTRIAGTARQVLDAIIRKTYGWNKRWDVISLSQLSKATGLSRQHVLRARDKLIIMRLLLPKKVTGSGLSYCFNKDYEQWRPLPKKVTPKRGVPKKGNRVYPKKVTEVLPKMGTKVLPKMVHTKETLKDSKDTIQKTFLPAKPDVVDPDSISPSHHKAAVDYWHEKYLDEIGFKYTKFDGKEGKHVKEMLEIFTLRQFKCLVDYILTTNADPWIADGRRTIPILYSIRDSIVQRLKNGKPTGTAKSRANLDAMAEYLIRRKADDERARPQPPSRRIE